MLRQVTSYFTEISRLVSICYICLGYSIIIPYSSTLINP
nr:MAG TPA: hypothetical protein [Caudoviricetes sp.]